MFFFNYVCHHLCSNKRTRIGEPNVGESNPDFFEYRKKRPFTDTLFRYKEIRLFIRDIVANVNMCI